MKHLESNLMTSFGASVALMLEEIKNTKGLHRTAYTKRLSFAIDVCLVAHGVRLVFTTPGCRAVGFGTIVSDWDDSTGYLVDAACPPNPVETFGALLVALRRKSIVFKDVMFWHHAPTMQSFLVHAPLLREKIAALLSGDTGKCVFVRLDKCPSVSREPPNALRDALEGMQLAMAEAPDTLMHTLSELLAGDILIPLAAVVIDYPIAYSPVSSVQTSFLGGEPLDIYSVSFKWTIESSDFTLGEHVLLKFSCPQVLASSDVELSPGTVTKRLHAKFVAVLERIGASIFVAHRTETLERVAL